jgi:hypothetical protein
LKPQVPPVHTVAALVTIVVQTWPHCPQLSASLVVFPHVADSGPESRPLPLLDPPCESPPLLELPAPSSPPAVESAAASAPPSPRVTESNPHRLAQAATSGTEATAIHATARFTTTSPGR